MKPALRALFLVATLGCAAAALYLWRLRCEGFGCSGVGIAWGAWAMAIYTPTLLLGAWAQAGAASAWLRAVFGAHVLMGLALLAHWLLR